MIDLSSLRDAVQRLTEAIVEQASEPDRKLLRAGLIQTFEYTYELSHKMLKRYLVSVSPSPALVERLPFEDLIRLGEQDDLLQSSVAAWKGFREARSVTSHTYNEIKAEGVLRSIPAFHREVTYLLKQLEQRTQQQAAR